MWLWNSITTRSRSGSDVFLDNGVAILRTHLARRGHQIHVEDWASVESFQSFSPPWLTRPILNWNTRLAMVADAREGRLVAQGYETTGPATAPLELTA